MVPALLDFLEFHLDLESLADPLVHAYHVLLVVHLPLVGLVGQLDMKYILQMVHS